MEGAAPTCPGARRSSGPGIRAPLSGGLGPRRVTGAHYVSLLGRAPFRTALANSLIVATISALIATAVTPPAAYSMARFRYAGRETFGLFILAMKMVPSVVLPAPSSWSPATGCPGSSGPPSARRSAVAFLRDVLLGEPPAEAWWS